MAQCFALGAADVRFRRVMPAGGPVAVVVLAALLAGCGSGTPRSASVPTAPPPVRPPVSYVARSAARVDLLQWTVTGHELTGFVDSRWITSADPVNIQSRTVNFHGILQGAHLTATPDDRSAGWIGTLEPSQLVLRWTSEGRPVTTTFLAARITDFDAAVQGLGDEAAATSTRIANEKAATYAANVARAAQSERARKAAARAAALARAQAGRISAAKAAAHRRQHPLP